MPGQPSRPARRDLLRLAAAGLLLAAAPAAAGCGSSARGSSGSATGSSPLRLWYWPGGLSDAAVRAVAATSAGPLDVRVVEGDFGQQLAAAVATGRGVLDITGIKGEHMPAVLQDAGGYLDLRELGADAIAGRFAAAKHQQGRTPQGRQVGLPIDVGPTATFLRADRWEAAGLPTDAASLAPLVSTWDGWFSVAAHLRNALPGSCAVRSSSDVFGVALAQQPSTFVTPEGSFAGDDDEVRTAWDLAVRSITEGVQAGIYDDQSYGAALSAGVVVGHLGPAWNGLDLANLAPATSGAWRVAACPGGPASIGGSFLALPTTCRDPQAAFAVVAALLTPANEALGFADASVFPAVTAAYALPQLTRGQAFFGGQRTIEVFGPAAAALPVVHQDRQDAALAVSFFTELANVEGGKSPDLAWGDAVSAARASFVSA